MSPLALLRELHTRGVILEPRGDKLAFGPKDKVTQELRARIVEHKEDLLRLLHPGALAYAYRQFWSTEESEPVEVFRTLHSQIDHLEKQVGEDRAWHILDTEARAWHQKTGICPFCHNPGELHFEGKKAVIRIDKDRSL
jgi:hypothetical protein